MSREDPKTSLGTVEAGAWGHVTLCHLLLYLFGDFCTAECSSSGITLTSIPATEFLSPWNWDLSFKN